MQTEKPDKEPEYSAGIDFESELPKDAPFKEENIRWGDDVEYDYNKDYQDHEIPGFIQCLPDVEP